MAKKTLNHMNLMEKISNWGEGVDGWVERKEKKIEARAFILFYFIFSSF